MSEYDLSPTRTEKAVNAAGVFVWEWAGDEGRLRIQGHGETGQGDLDGQWLLGDFLSMLDGMSGQRLAQRLTAGASGDRLDMTLSLADGKSLHLLGAIEDNDRAKGLMFSPGMSQSLATGVPVEAAFQPIIRLRDGHIAGFEALARWRGDTGELLSAGSFNSPGNGPGAEIFMGGLALAMLDQAANALGDWKDRFPGLDLFVQVNMTGADLYRADVLEKVSALVQSGRFPEGALRIELTEQMALRDFAAGVAAATALKASGVGLVLDDFGSGHSSLAWLAAIPANGIKLDPQLMSMAGTPRVDTILSGIARLAHKLGMTVTAEGVEDLGQVSFLKGIGCDYAQGFAYAHAMEKSKADRFLESQVRLQSLGKSGAV